MAKTHTHKVQIAVPKREGFDGIHAAQKFFPEGVTEHELTGPELADVLHRPAVMVMQDGKHVKHLDELSGYDEKRDAILVDENASPEDKAKADPNSAINAVKRASSGIPAERRRGIVSPPGPTLPTPGSVPVYDGTDEAGKPKDPDGVSVVTTPITDGAKLTSKTTTTGPDGSVPFDDAPSTDAPTSDAHGKRKRY